jgi:hypothetical protein
MADEQLTGLFAEGTAPERDAAFAQRVDARIVSVRRGARALALSVRVLVMLTLGAIAFATVRLAEPTLRQIAEISPEFMGVPVPLMLTVFGLGLLARLPRFIGLRLR